MMKVSLVIDVDVTLEGWAPWGGRVDWRSQLAQEIEELVPRYLFCENEAGNEVTYKIGRPLVAVANR